MKFLCYADTHGYLPELPDWTPDLIFLAGDLGPDGPYQEPWLHEVYAPWVEALHSRGIEVVATAGNHDEWLLSHPEAAKGLPGFVLLDQAAEVKGLRVYGLPWVPYFNGHGPELPASILEAIPHGLDVLLLHGPPYWMGSQYQHGSYPGCPALLRAIEAKAPKLVLFGHDHLSRGAWLWPSTSFVNVTSGCHGLAKLHRPFPVNWSEAGPEFFLPGNRGRALSVPGRYLLEREDGTRRVIALGPSGLVTEGTDTFERWWRVKEASGVLKIVIQADLPHGERGFLTQELDGTWRGFWKDGGRPWFRLTPMPS
jgi:Icc-related predicted phosphoesterase